MLGLDQINFHWSLAGAAFRLSVEGVVIAAAEVSHFVRSRSKSQSHKVTSVPAGIKKPSTPKPPINQGLRTGGWTLNGEPSGRKNRTNPAARPRQLPQSAQALAQLLCRLSGPSRSLANLSDQRERDDPPEPPTVRLVALTGPGPLGSNVPTRVSAPLPTHTGLRGLPPLASSCQASDHRSWRRSAKDRPGPPTLRQPTLQCEHVDAP